MAPSLPPGGAPPGNPTLSKALNAIKIRLAMATGSRPHVLFDVSAGGERVGLLEATVDEVCLPLTVSEVRRVEGNDQAFHLPDRILAAIQSVVPQSQVPLWLSFPAPSGYLAGLPWEQLLRPRIENPMMRLSYTKVQPVTPRETRDIILCFTFARAKETFLQQSPEQILSYFLERVPANFLSYTTFHVFADFSLWPILNTIRDRMRGNCKIEIYDPQGAAKYDVPEDDDDETPDQIESPWLKWMRDAMGSRSVDVVHFVAHGYVGREDGFLAFSESPVVNEDEYSARFVGVRQLCSFLDKVGAWSAALTSPPGNYSILGLRLLADQMAHMRPGPVLFHDMMQDPNRVALDEAYQFAYAIEEAECALSPAVNICCHPEWAMPWAERDPESRHLLEELTLAGELADILHGPENTPSWLASGQRSLETSVAQLVSNFRGDSERALKSPAAEALRFTARLLARHAKAMRNVEEK